MSSKDSSFYSLSVELFVLENIWWEGSSWLSGISFMKSSISSAEAFSQLC